MYDQVPQMMMGSTMETTFPASTGSSRLSVETVSSPDSFEAATSHVMTPPARPPSMPTRAPILLALPQQMQAKMGNTAELTQMP